MARPDANPSIQMKKLPAQQVLCVQASKQKLLSAATKLRLSDMRSTYALMSVCVLTVASFVKNATRFGVSIYLLCFQMTIKYCRRLACNYKFIAFEKGIS